MGRIRQKYIKRTAATLIKKHGEEFSLDFNKNREIVEKYIEVQGKILRNRIAGYATTITKKNLRKEKED